MTADVPAKPVGPAELLAELIRRAGRTPRSIARDAALGETVVRDIVNGTVQDPRLSTVRGLAKVLGPEVFKILLGDLLPPPLGTASVPLGCGHEQYVPLQVYDPEDNPTSISLFRAEALQQLANVPISELSIVRIPDDTMVPTLSEGDNVLVHTIPEIDRDGLFAFSARGTRRLLVRRIRRTLSNGKLTILCDNPNYPPETVPDDAITVRGRVRWMGRTLG